ncbi:uncharacterized protein LOC123263297 isoform X1 [Cotesia glomerata]|uniref:Ionotropic receptor n=2 Tax=Cotesia glomerata TaxID=32391 RepID=A0AAV7IMA2_COTGL|nr:uncharacterized protein LOC123263297 isoform X1 [Cotesia glomerata]KAH0555138.1 hypothetical protein KQX54_015509 [Cotesia glomerata]
MKISNLKYLLIFGILASSKFYSVTNAEVCLQILRNKNEFESAMYYSGRIRKWNEATKEFDHFESLTGNGTLVCTVDYLDNITGQDVIVAVDTMLPYVEEGTNGTVDGYIGSIWNVLEESLKFKSKYKNGTGYKLDIFFSGGCNVLLGPVIIDKYYGGHCQYSHQLTTISYSLYTREVAARVSMWWYIRIFRRDLWFATIFYIVGISGVLFGMYRLKKMACSNYIESNNEFAEWSFNFLCVLGGITGQGVQNLPSSWSLRCLILTSLIISVLITCGFNSTLMSHLSISGTMMPFNDLHGIYLNGHGSYSICVRSKDGPGIYLKQMERNWTEMGFHIDNIMNRLNCPKMEDKQDIKSKLCDKDKRIYFEAPEIFLSVYREVKHKCNIVKVAEHIQPRKISFLATTSWPYRKLINKYLLKFRTAGILNYFEHKFISREFPDTYDSKFSSEIVTFEHIQLIFMGLCIMYIVSAIICIAENIWVAFANNNKVQRIISRSQLSHKMRQKKFMLPKIYINDNTFK